ncbi:MAG: hypothetical protein K2Y56_01740 [Methylobacterium sp.]|uniref:hypothetical protein n=1 Tax=Methylobacterium sp. TaxID=409 RepID=UPI0025F5A610|nr:hypothetical protein [Methylobacterium sp.]MBX9930254.1 hypothetical protein [Methylobacterium sp.]
MSTTNTTIGGPGTSPDDIAAAAGLPRGSSKPVGDALDANRRLVEEASDPSQHAKSRSTKASDAATDVLNRAKEGVTSAATNIGERVAQTAEGLRGQASQAYDDTREWASDQHATHRRKIGDLSGRGQERIQQGRSAVEGFVSENPLLVGVVGVAAGLLLGALLPRTRAENEAVGPWADDLRDQGLRYAQDITNRGRQFVETALDPDNLSAATERSTSQDQGQPAAASGPRTH